MRSIITIAACAFIALCANAQPAIDWLHHYDFRQLNQSFGDIYALPDGGIACCGGTSVSADVNVPAEGWILRTNRAGDPLWSRQFNGQGSGEAFSTIIDADGGDLVTAGTETIAVGPQQAMTVNVTRVSSEGDLRWTHTYQPGQAWAIIELKNGNFCVACTRGTILCINGNGDLIWSRQYNLNGVVGLFYCMREVADGVVAAGMAGGDNNSPIRIWAIKAAQNNGDPMWNHGFQESWEQYCTSMVSTGDGGLALAGKIIDPMDHFIESDYYLLFINADGEQTSSHRYDWREGNDGDLNERCNGIERMANGDYVLAGWTRFPNENEIDRASVIVVNHQGQERWRRRYDLSENEGYGARSYLWSPVKTSGGAIMLGGFCYYNNCGQDGLLIKLLPDIEGPIIIMHSPEDTVLTCLAGDSTQFIVRAINREGHEQGINYDWLLNDSLVAHGDTTVIHFDSLGIDTLTCRVTLNQFVATVTWHIFVRDLFIASHPPDTLSLAIKRGRSVDFALDSVRATPGDSVNYAWTVTNLSNMEREDAGRDAHATIQFDHTGNFGVEGLAFRGEARDNVVWTVAVRSAILDYWPSRLSLTFPPDTIVHFGVIPFNADSGAVHYEWRFDQDLLGMDTSEVALNFGEVGDYQVGVIVTDSTEADTDLAPKKWTRS